MNRLTRLVILFISFVCLAASVQAAPPEKDICPAPEDHAARQAAVQAACSYFDGVPSSWGLHSAFDAAGQVITCMHFSCAPATQASQGEDKPAVALKRFLLKFDDAYLVHQPGKSGLQIAAQDNVLSYGSDWQVRQLKPYLFHLKQNVWKDFYWKVNTSRHEVYRVTGGQFGKMGGTEQKIGIGVDTVGSADKPTRFLLRFNDAYLVHQAGQSGLQIVAQDNVLSYGNDWQVQQLKPYLFHLKQNVWKDFYWKVNTSRKEAYRVKGGQFGQMGGQETKMDMIVDPVY
jgi:hypothetical protein